MYFFGDGKIFREKTFASPQDLWEAFAGYYEWVKDNPWYKSEPIKSGENAGDLIKVPTERPMTLGGFATHVGMSERRLSDYGRLESHIEYRPVYERIVDIIRAQKFEGAAVGAFNANIIARDLGLAEKTDNNHSGKIDIPSTLEVVIKNAPDKRED